MGSDSVPSYLIGRDNRHVRSKVKGEHIAEPPKHAVTLSECSIRILDDF